MITFAIIIAILFVLLYVLRAVGMSLYEWEKIEEELNEYHW